MTKFSKRTEKRENFTIMNVTHPKTENVCTNYKRNIVENLNETFLTVYTSYWYFK